MNIAVYLQERQYGGRGKKSKNKHTEDFVEEKVAESFVNKACSVSGRCRSTFIMEFSPDGITVASTHGDHSVRVTDIGTGQCVCTLHGHPRTPWCLAYHPSSSHILASGCLGGQVRIWDLYGAGYGCEVWQTENTTVIAALTFHPTEHVLVIAAGNSIYFWDWSKPEPFAKCSTTHEYERIRWLRYDILGHFLYTGISNNTTTHREDVSSAASNSSSQERPVSRAEGQPSRLSSVYNNIINCFQDYRRDRLMNQLHSGGYRQNMANQSSGPSTEMDMYPGLQDGDIVRPRSPSSILQDPVAPGDPDQMRSPISSSPSVLNISQPRVRQNELLMASYARRLAQRSRNVTAPYTNPVSEGSRDSGAGPDIIPGPQPRQTTLTDNLMTLANLANSRIVCPNPADNADIFLLNPASDPFLATAPVDGDHIDLSSSSSILRGENGSDANNVRFPLQPAVIRGVMSPPPVPISNDFDDNILPRVGDMVTSQDDLESEELNGTHDSSVNSAITGSQMSFGNGEFSHSGLRDRSHEVSCEDFSINSVRDMTNITHTPETALLTAISDPNVLPYLNKTNTTNCVSLSPLLAKYIQSQGAGQTTVMPSCSRQTKPFASIRDRLQTTIPLSSDNGSAASGSVRVMPSTTEVRGIPQVTVISASDLAPSSTSVTWSCNNQIPSVSGRGVLTTRNDHILNLNSATNQVPVISRLADRRSSTERLSENIGDNSNRTVNQSSLGDIMNSYSQHGSEVVASTSSHSSLFENIFHNSNSTRCESRPTGRGRSYLSSFRSQPYNWQNRTQYMSIMGPYLESRGINLGNRTNASQSSQSNGPDQLSVIDRALSRVMPPDPTRVAQYSHNLQRDFGHTRSHSRDQAFSDTESELSSHLNQSGAYFVPITDDPARAHSATSTHSASSGERNSDPAFLRQSNTPQGSVDSAIGQSSRSSSSGTVPSGASVVQDLELVMDQNENYTTQRPNANLTNPLHHLSEIRLRNHDSNNNSIHIVHVQPENTTRETAGPPNQDFVSLRNNFVSMTDQIEREMSDLNRRINALRDSFNQSLVYLRQDRSRYETIGNNLLSETATNLSNNSVNMGGHSTGVTRVPPVITVTRLQESQNGFESALRDSVGPASTVPLSQPPTLLETSLRSHHRGRQLQTNRGSPPSDGDYPGPLEDPEERQNWRRLHRHYLHPHYSTSILDDTINRPNNGIQSAINRAIAGAFMGTGESAVANNIISQTHRIQFWDFSKCDIPDISSSTKNIVVPHCKLHNSASCDISQNSDLLATFVPSHHGFPDDNILTVYSLLPETRGQCLYTKSFGPNAISISISPRNKFVLVGLAAKRLSWVFTSNQLVAQIYKLDKKGAGEKSMKHTKDILHTCNTDIRSHVSGNSARWLPLAGQGLVYGTNRGDLNICKPGVKVIVDKAEAPETGYSVENLSSTGNIRRCLLRRVPWMNYSSPHRVSTATQTAGVRQSASTQTEISENTDENEIFV